MSRLQAIRAAIAEFDAMHERGAAARDFALGLLAIGVVLGDMIVLALMCGAAS